VQLIFPGKEFAYLELTILYMARFGLPVSVTPDYSVHSYLNEYKSSFIRTEPGLSRMQMG